EKSFNVTVAAAPVTTSPRATTTTAGPGPGPTTAGPTSTTATTVAGAPVVAGATTSTKVATTTTTAVETTEAPPAPVTTTATTVRPAGRDTPLVLTETPPKRSSGPPVWVGAVVGISGGLGLLFSARPWRRRGGPPNAGEPLEDETRQLVR